MVQKDQNRNEWKMPLELFGSFVRESFSVLRVLFEIKIEMLQLDKLIRFNERLGDGIRRIGESKDKLRSIYVFKTTAILPRVPELNGTLVYYKRRAHRFISAFLSLSFEP
jgi:hypothetical protein